MSKINNIILPKTDIMLASANSIDQICQPLRKYGITAFSHTRVYDDGSFIDMADNIEMPECFYYKSDIYKEYAPDVEPELFGEGFLLCSTIENNESIRILREDLNIDHVIVLITRAKDHYQLWNFGSTPNNPSIINFYLNNLDILQGFTDYFNEKCHALIKDFERDKIIRHVDKRDDQPTAITKNINSKDRFLLQEVNSQITKREAECLYWVMRGYSSKETGNILSISYRTVEKHLENIKRKSNCNSKSGLRNMFSHCSFITGE